MIPEDRSLIDGITLAVQKCGYKRLPTKVLKIDCFLMARVINFILFSEQSDEDIRWFGTFSGGHGGRWSGWHQEPGMQGPHADIVQPEIAGAADDPNKPTRRPPCDESERHQPPHSGEVH